jgi:hypothetical protein
MALRNDMLGPHRFGKMFPDLAPFRPPDDALSALGDAMLDDAAQPPGPGDCAIPAGFTYLGQFIDHDLTLDQTSGFPIITDPDELYDARTVTLDLDNLYGLGPVRQPELYDPNFPPREARFLIGSTADTADDHPAGQQDTPTSLPNDLPRQPSGTALISDLRDDENLILAQTHLAFLKFHNRVIETLPAEKGHHDTAAEADARFIKLEEDTYHTPFHRAMRLVRWHYQWIVIHDHLGRLVDPAVLDDVLQHGRRFYRFEHHPYYGVPYMPLEFSVAAYRLGHSMVREAYGQNRMFNGTTVGDPGFGPASLEQLFTFTGHGGFESPFSVLPSKWVIDWRRWHEVGDPVPDGFRNHARQIDTRISPTLHNLPLGIIGAAAPPLSLPVRNLLRGSRVGLPTGQDVATAMGFTVLTPDELANGTIKLPDGSTDGEIVRQFGFDRETPLWYYILKEAEVEQQGQRLGQVGSRLVCEVLIGILQADKTSYLAKEPHWKPTLPSATPGTFTMADLLRFVDDIDPLGPAPGGP